MHSITTIRNGTTRWFVRSDVAKPFRDLIVDIQSEREARIRQVETIPRWSFLIRLIRCLQ